MQETKTKIEKADHIGRQIPSDLFMEELRKRVIEEIRKSRYTHFVISAPCKGGGRRNQ